MNQVCSIGFLVAAMYRMLNSLDLTLKPGRVSRHSLLTEQRLMKKSDGDLVRL